MRSPVFGLARRSVFAKRDDVGVAARRAACALHTSPILGGRARGRGAAWNQPCFLVLGEGTGDLAHHLPRRVVACGQVIARGRQQPHPSADQEGDAQLLGHQLARKAAGILDDDGTHAVALDPIQKGREARPCLDRVGTGDRRIIELIDDLEAGALGEALNGVALAFLAVLVRADVWFSPRLSPVISGFISDN